MWFSERAATAQQQLQWDQVKGQTMWAQSEHRKNKHQKDTKTWNTPIWTHLLSLLIKKHI